VVGAAVEVEEPKAMGFLPELQAEVGVGKHEIVPLLFRLILSLTLVARPRFS
jgi:hypothetical protein